MKNANVSRTRHSLQNISFGMILQGVTTILSFITRTCLIKWIGTGAVGLNGLFSEVIGMISMAEMGVGAAIIYNLYTPLANHDTKKICQLMNLYKKAYHIIALVTFLMGCALTPFVQHIVKKVDYSTAYIQAVFFLFVIKTSTSYLFSYKFSLLNADQKRYIQSLITLIVRVIGVGFQVAALYFTKNFIAYLSVSIAETIIINLIGSWFVSKHYPYLKSTEHLPKEERQAVFKNIRYIFIKKLSGKITNSTDNILISTLVSTLQVGLYSNYTVIYSVIRHGCNQVASGINGSLGNLMASESNEQCSRTLRKVTFAFFCIGFPAMLCLYAGVDTLIQIWLGEEFLMDGIAVLLTCLIIGIEFIKTPLWQIMEVSGLFHRDMWISVAGSSVNLVTSIACGKIYGIIGIFIGTIATYVIQIILKIRLLYCKRLLLSPRNMYLDWFGYSIAFMFGILVIKSINALLTIESLFLHLICQVGIAGIFALLVILLFWGRSSNFAYVKHLALRILKRKKL